MADNNSSRVPHHPLSETKSLHREPKRGLPRGIVIGGGVGPMAGVMLHEKIIQQTVTDGTDQGHLDVIHVSCSRLIADRTAFVLGKTSRNPGRAMGELVNAGLVCLRRCEETDGDTQLEKPGSNGIAGDPCNTFHADPIFSLFTQTVRSAHPEAVIINMIQETINKIGRHTRIGVLSTTGTREAGVWTAALEKQGYKAVYVREANQKLLHETIYHPAWGLKAKSPPSPAAIERAARFSSELLDKGAEKIILGCTELPLAARYLSSPADITSVTPGRLRGIPEQLLQAVAQGCFIDPMDMLAKALTAAAGK